MPEPSAQDEDMTAPEQSEQQVIHRAASIVLNSPPTAAPQQESHVLEDVDDWGSSFSDTGSDEDLTLDPMPIPPLMTGRTPAVRDGHWREYRRELNWR